MLDGRGLGHLAQIIADMTPGHDSAAAGTRRCRQTKALGNNEVREKMATMGLEPAASSPEQFSAFLRSEIPKYSKILKESGAKLD